MATRSPKSAKNPAPDGSLELCVMTGKKPPISKRQKPLPSTVTAVGAEPEESGLPVALDSIEEVRAIDLLETAVLRVTNMARPRAFDQHATPEIRAALERELQGPCEELFQRIRPKTAAFLRECWSSQHAVPTDSRGKKSHFHAQHKRTRTVAVRGTDAPS